MHSEFLKPFFKKLDDDQIDYAVIRNHEGLPESIPGSDIDILINPADKRRFDVLIRNQCKASKWKLVRTSSKDFRIQNYVLSALDNENQPVFIVLDVMTAVGWNGFTAWSSADILQHLEPGEGVRHLSRPAEAAVTTLTSLSYVSEFKKDQYSSLVRSVASESNPVFIALMNSATGATATIRITEFLANEDHSQIADAADVMRSALKKSAFKRPFQRLVDIVWSTRFKLKRLFSPPGILIAVLGTDGSGKSTLVEELSQRLLPVFGATDTAHLRPRLLPDISRVSGRASSASPQQSATSTHTRKPGIVGSLIRWSYYWLDYLIGYHIIFRPKLARKSAIVVDRYFYDFEFDYGQKNVKLPGWIVRAMQHLLPSPDVVIHVDTDTNTVLERRGNEVDESEIDRQRTAIKSITDRISNSGTVDGAQNPNAVANQAIALIVQKLARD